ncbi:MAG: hypothetical protein U1F42_09815 [Candidatus Competibacteraceae bacterium]
MEKTQLAGHFDAIVCAHELGLVKEQPEFWPRLRTVEAFEPAATLLVDDNLLILQTAREYGISYLISVLRPGFDSPTQAPRRISGNSGFFELLPVV